MQILEPKTEERPHYYEFKKCEIMADHPTMAKLNYDPFPDAKMEDVVRTEIISRELILTAKLEIAGSESPSVRGKSIEYNGNKFLITTCRWSLKSPIVEFEGKCFLTRCEPMKVLAQ
ncbi:MAG TPA: hypothetical protein VHX90_00020 [Verrucomicrobiae bacterium]|jgi:hypothetical protein|nr:hypothetical protein [Verrucomicrobiae bacterium]